MMTDVVVAPSLGGLLVGCVLLLAGAVPAVVMAPSVIVGCVLLTGTVPVVVIAPSVWDREVVCEGVGVDAVDRKHTSCHFATNNHDSCLIQSYTA